MNAYVYTQLTDVETERNGLVTYDRQVIKAPKEALAQLNTSPPALTVLAPTAFEDPVSWQYTTSQPAENWYEAGYDDTGWLTGDSGFGTAGTPGTTINTVWSTADIWLRRSFELSGLTSTGIENLYFKVHHDEDIEIYLNGQLVASYAGYTSSYVVIPFTAAAKEAINPSGANLLAVHVHQATGGQSADVGIISIGERP